ncbi:hypothetical protein PRIPAC_80955, partial [Pristionchus pacificus]
LLLSLVMDGGNDDDDHLSVDASLPSKDHQPTIPMKNTKMKTKRSDDNQRGLNTQVWKRVGADKVPYPDDESIEEPKKEVKRMNIGNEKMKRREEIIPRMNEMKREKSEKKVEKKKGKEPKHRLASPIRNGSSVSTSSCDSLSSILGHSLTMTSSSGSIPNFTGITSSSPTDSPSPNPSEISLDPFGKEKKCTCAHKPTSNIAKALSIDTPLTTSTVDQSFKTTTKPMTSLSHHSSDQSSNDVPSFTDLCGSEYDSDDESSPPNGRPCIYRNSSSFRTCNDRSQVDDASWYTVDQTNRSMRKRRSKRKRTRKMRHPISIRSIRPLPQEETTVDPAKAWAVLIIMAIAVLTYRYSLPMCHGKRHHHH